MGSFLMELHDLIPLFYFGAFLIGLALGSFLNSWIWRTRENIRIVGDARSICTHCRRTLRWYENVPLLSYLFLRGRCRTCRRPIGWHYPAVELFTAVAFIGVFWYHDVYIDPFNKVQFFRDIFFLTFLVVIFVFDALYQIVLSRIVWPATFIGLIFNWYLGIPWQSMVLGAFAAGGFFLLQYLVSRGRWIGGGDVRLGVMMGVWLGWPAVLAALFFAYVLGAVVALFLLVARKATGKTAIPFGTFLAIGTFFAMYHGQEVVDWYLNLLKF